MTTEPPAGVVAKDAQGKLFEVGQKVARAAKMYYADGLYVEVCEVTAVKEGRVYLNGSHKAINFPSRLAIISVS